MKFSYILDSMVHFWQIAVSELSKIDAKEEFLITAWQNSHLISN